MPLTSRQRAFLESLFDVYHDHGRQPVHYTALARALGVANSTAYEMLKLLENKGYVSSEYRLAAGHSGPGRSMVLFRPTMKALRTFRHLLGEDVRAKEWEDIKEKVLGRLALQGVPGDERLLDDLLVAIPLSQDPLSYCGRVVAASLVRIRESFLSRMPEFGILRDMVNGEATGWDALSLLPGFALGLAYAVRQNPSWLSRLTEYAKRYQGYLRQMDEGARRRLLRFSREIMAALQSPLETE
jgi:DNA-binding PadR family transcriptional regulator